MWLWVNKFVKKDHCPEFKKDKLKNPITKRKIKEEGPVQKWFKDACSGKSKSKVVVPEKKTYGLRKRINNLSEFVKEQGPVGLEELVNRILAYQTGRFTKDLKIAFTKGYKGAVNNELQEVIIDFGSRKFRISTTGPISKRLQRLSVGEGFREEDIEGTEVSQKNFCSTKNVKALPNRKKFEAQPHQLKAVEFMASNPNARLLLEHGLGSGKTCTSAMVIDSYLRRYPDNLVYFFSPGNLRSNFIAEYCSFCPVDRRIDPTNNDYNNFRFFSLDDGTLKKKLPRRFEDCLVVVDEAQSLIGSIKTGENPPTHDEMDNMEGLKSLSVLYAKLTRDYSSIKLLMLSGTPMPDTLEQHYNCLRLLKPEDMRSVSYEGFLNMFYSDDLGRFVPKQESLEMVTDLYSNCISFYKTSQTDVARVLTTYEEINLEVEDPLAEIILQAMSSEQRYQVIPLEGMIKMYIKSGMSPASAAKFAVFMKSRAVRRAKSCGLSNIVYPSQLERMQTRQMEGTDGDNDEEIEKEEREEEEQKGLTEDDEVLRDFKDNMELFFETFCPKLGKLMENLENDNVCPGKQIIYCPFKVRHGVNLISKILKVMGISNVVYSGDVTQGAREKILRKYNDVSNDLGQKTKVFLFTDAAAEGISLMSVRGVHLINEDIYASHMRQVVGRAVRYLSHARLPEEDREVTVFRYRLYVDGVSSDEDNEGAGVAREQRIKYLESMVHTTWSI